MARKSLEDLSQEDRIELLHDYAKDEGMMDMSDADRDWIFEELYVWDDKVDIEECESMDDSQLAQALLDVWDVVEGENIA